MKLTKLALSVLFIGSLAACSQGTNSANKAEEQAQTAVKTEPSFETAAYFCDVQGKKNQTVSATYTFVNGKIDSATISINRKVVGDDMKVNAAYNDGTQFVEGKKVWTLDNGFSQASAAKTLPIMFTDNNKILARNCVLAR